jgi:hypothetical protein
MLDALLSAVNSVIYTTLAFLVPLFFTVKSLLRQYTVTIVAPTSFASASVDNAAEDESEVPSTFIEPSPSAFKTATVKTDPTPSNTSAWLYYWAILALVHCFTGLYERLVLPFVGNSLLYHSAKYAGLYWLAKDEAQGSRALWTALIAPFAAKYEKDADQLVQLVKEQGKITLAKSVASLRQLKTKAIKAE